MEELEMCKRIVSIALALLLLAVIGIAAPVMASGDARLTLSGPAEADPGDLISVVVGIENNPGLVGARLVIDFDDEYLRLGNNTGNEAFTFTEGFNNPTYSPTDINLVTNRVVVFMDRAVDAIDWTGDTFITLRFEALKAGPATIRLSSDDISNAVPEQIEDKVAQAVPYTVTITGSDFPVTGVPNIAGYTAALAAFLLISAVLWGAILRRRLSC